jgi:polar amino acid transport system substrate-binding protein
MKLPYYELVCGVLITCLLCGAGCLSSNPQSLLQGPVTPSPAGTSQPAVTVAATPAIALKGNYSPAEKERLVTFVKSAVEYVQQNGKEKALAEFNNPGGSFARDSLYIFADDYKGTTLAMPFARDWIGTDRWNMTDPAGNHMIRMLAATAKNGSGLVEYYSDNPFEENITELKLSYVSDVDGSWFLGSGIYAGRESVFIPSATASIPSEGRMNTTIVSLVNDARDYALKYGKEKALAEFNNQKGRFVSGELYVFAYDYNGTVIALPFQKELLGTNRIGNTDPAGVYYVRDIGEKAKNGGGFVEYLYPDPTRNFSLLKKVSYSLDVDGTWYVGSGYYVMNETGKA